MKKKKRILLHSNFCKMFTGFGKHTKNILSYLYKTGKYDLIELSNGFVWDDPRIKSTPWESYGSLPNDPKKLADITSNPVRKASAGYGGEMIDHAIEKFKPDVYIGVEDIWAFRGFFDKPWWNKTNCIIHTTLDSLPILPDAVEAAPKIKNYFVWASFAEKALHKLGHTHVKTVRGSLETKNFYKLPDEEINDAKKAFSLENNFIIGFVFRNQLRKSVPNLLDGFKLFDQHHPEANANLLLHTNWTEGWDIKALIKEKMIDPRKILTTYKCSQCQRFYVSPFAGPTAPCMECNTNSCQTTGVQNGISEEQLNIVYNLMDVYCHPFTSGGQELPIQEAKLTELITLVTNYSCGEDSCSEESGGLPLEWSEYREPGTQFIKATTSPQSIYEQLKKVFFMSPESKKQIGKKARNYVLDNYAVEIVGKFFEDYIDNLPEVNYDFNFQSTKNSSNAFYEPKNELKDKEWIESLYINLLGEPIDTQGVIHWVDRLKKDMNRNSVLNYFRKVAFQKQEDQKFESFKEEIKKDKNKNRIAYIEPSGEKEVIIASSILPSIKKTYPNHKIYFFTTPEYTSLIDSHSCVEKVFSYSPQCDDILDLEGFCDKEGFFDMVFSPHLSIKNNYFRNNKDKVAYNVYEH